MLRSISDMKTSVGKCPELCLRHLYSFCKHREVYVLFQHRHTPAHWGFYLCQDLSVLRFDSSSFPTFKVNNHFYSFPAGPRSNPAIWIHKQTEFVVWREIHKYMEVFLYFLCVLVICLHVCLCTIWVPNAYSGQKRASDSLIPELQTGITCHVHAEN